MNRKKQGEEEGSRETEQKPDLLTPTSDICSTGMETPPVETAKRGPQIAVMALSVFVGTVLMLVKFYAYSLVGSAAILSDALESIINVVAGGFALWSVALAAKPPDPSHPYGHGKIENFSAGFEGALIILAAAGIIWEAVPKIANPRPLPGLDIGILILFGTAVVNLALGLLLVRTGRRTRSIAVTADGKHVLTDVYTTGGVLIGLLLVRQTGWLRLDGIMACLVAVNILVIGTMLVRDSFSGLMDRSDPELLNQITTVIAENRKHAWVDIHRLRAWRSGNRIHVDFHLILPRDMSLDEAHCEVTEIEQLLKDRVPCMGDALIHAEPCIDPECLICFQEPCENRRVPASEHPSPWCRDEMTSPTDPAGLSCERGDRVRSESGRSFTRAAKLSTQNKIEGG